MGVSHGENDRPRACTRYLDWIATTPIMLYEVCHLGGADFPTTMMVCGVDVLMISTGIVSAVIPLDRAKLPWFFMSCVFFAVRRPVRPPLCLWHPRAGPIACYFCDARYSTLSVGFRICC